MHLSKSFSVLLIAMACVLTACQPVWDGRLTYMEPTLAEGDLAILNIASHTHRQLLVKSIDGAKLPERDMGSAYAVKVLPGDRLIDIEGKSGFWEPKLRFHFMFVRGHRYQLEMLDQQVSMKDMATGAESRFP
jgi:hypothetical protein